MRKHFGDCLHIGLAQDGIALLRSSGWLRRRTQIVAEHAITQTEPGSAVQSLQQLGVLLSQAQCSGLPTSIVLTDAWVRMWMVTPPGNTVRLADCQAAAAMRFQALYGEAPADWHMQADWQAQQAFLACALPYPLHQALQQLAAEYKLTLLKVVPFFIAAWNRWRKDVNANAWFGVLNHQTLTLGVIERQKLSAIRALQLSADAAHNRSWLAAQLVREALRLNLPTPSRLQLCGQVPPAWLKQTGGPLHCTQLDDQATANGTAGLLLAQHGIGG